jgi:hypothetical protein
MGGGQGEGEMVAAGGAAGQTANGLRGAPALWAAAAAIALYAVTIGYGFVFDDLSLIGPDGPRALGNGTLPYRPLRYLTYLFDHWIGGGSPVAYHASNVALHALCSALTALVASRLGAGRVAAVSAGMLVAVHPLSVEAAAYVAGRRDLLSSVCGLAAILAWTNPRGRTALAVLAVLGAVAAKESGAIFVAVLLLASSTGVGPPVAPSSLRTLAGVGVAAVLLPVSYGAIGPLAPKGSACAMVNSLASMAFHYARQIVWPLQLSVEYPALATANTACDAILAPGTLAGMLLLGFAAGVVLAALVPRAPRIEASAATFSAAWVAVVYLAVAGVVGAHEPGADRHAYPLLAALAVSLALFASSVPALQTEKARGIGRVVAVGSISALALVSALRLPSWRDSRALWSAAVVTAPASGRAHHNLAGVLLENGELDAAALEVRQARKLDYAPALAGDAAIACARGRVHRARELVARARALGMAAEDCAVDVAR